METTTEEAIRIVAQFKAQADAQIAANKMLSDAHQITLDRLQGIKETPAADYVVLQDTLMSKESEITTLQEALLTKENEIVELKGVVEIKENEIITLQTKDVEKPIVQGEVLEIVA